MGGVAGVEIACPSRQGIAYRRLRLAGRLRRHRSRGGDQQKSAPGQQPFHAIRPLGPPPAGYRWRSCRTGIWRPHGPGPSGYNTGKIGGDPGMTRTCDLRFRKPPLYPAELRDRAHRRQAPTDCGFLAAPGFNRYPCGRVETRGGIRPDMRIGLTGRVATARRDETGEFNP